MSVRTGQTEPLWPTAEGARIIEYSLAEAVAVAPEPPPKAPDTTLPPEIEDRYWDGWKPRTIIGRIA